ncbi:MAG TPA: adenylate/guanylate cyclase domain-containing protein [Gaiellaceae bacterium]|nr:adenylate/guanylate cyclase domain-containing protein [Gaiellaceae bacterium]
MFVWPLLFLVPLGGLALLLLQPDLDVDWENHPGHFWLVLSISLVSVALGALTSEAATRRSDPRLFLVSLAFLSSAGFLGLHALATPGVLLEGRNAGFVIATSVGLLIAAVFAAWSSLDRPNVRSTRLLRWGLALIVLTWAAVSLAEVPPLDRELSEDETDRWLFGLAIPAVVLYGIAAWRYWQLYRRRPSELLAGVTAAWIFLGEASIAVAFSRNWHASWWEWHLLMAAAFGIVAFTAQRERRHGEVFASLYLDDTLGRIDQRYASAVKAAASEGLDEAELRRRFDLAADEAAVVRRAAGEVEAVESLLQPYLSPQLAARLREEPEKAELGGEEREVSVLFADLQEFTAFSERHTPAEVLAMLNSYWARAVPVVLGDHGGMIERFAGDAIMVVFNAAADQPDHALRAARAALELQRAAEGVGDGRADWPRFRVGINTGPAIVGNVGTQEQRSFTAIGDTTNLAARLQTAAEPGEVVIGEATHEALRGSVDAQPLGELDLRGKSAPVAAYRLTGLR